MKKVSIIIPFYNGAELLPESLDSALAQTYKNTEIILVNDGSKENIEPILKKYGDSIIYRYQENAGAAAARNLGMSIATGDYFAFLDADDVWLPTKLEKQIDFMEKIGAVWCHTGFYYWTPSNNRLKVVNNFMDYGDVYKIYHVSARIATPSVIVSRRAMLEHPEIDFPVEMRKAQDTAYYTQLAKYYPLALVKEPLCKVRMRTDNTNKQSVLRFNIKAQNYLKTKNDKSVPKGAKYIFFIYYVYAKLFGKKTSPFKEKLALACWTFPFALERIYKKYLLLVHKPDSKYLKA